MKANIDRDAISAEAERMVGTLHANLGSERAREVFVTFRRVLDCAIFKIDQSERDEQLRSVFLQYVEKQSVPPAAKKFVPLVIRGGKQ